MLTRAIFCLFTDREGVDCTRRIWEISQPEVKHGEVSEQSPSVPASSAHDQEITRMREKHSGLP